MNPELKNRLLDLQTLCDSFDSEAGDAAKDSLRQLVREDLCWFVVYLSMADDVIASNEVDFVNAYFDTSYTQKDFLEWSRDGALFDLETVNSVPASVIRFVQTDNRFFGENAIVTDYTSTLIGLFKDLGMELICCDKELEMQELTKYNDYIGMLEAYAATALRQNS